MFVALNKNRAIVVFWYCNGISLEEDSFLIAEFRLKPVLAVTLSFLALIDTGTTQTRRYPSLTYLSLSCPFKHRVSVAAWRWLWSSRRKRQFQARTNAAAFIRHKPGKWRSGISYGLLATLLVLQERRHRRFLILLCRRVQAAIAKIEKHSSKNFHDVVWARAQPFWYSRP